MFYAIVTEFYVLVHVGQQQCHQLILKIVTVTGIHLVEVQYVMGMDLYVHLKSVLYCGSYCTYPR